MAINIVGTGSALPDQIVSNFDLQKLVDTSDEWIRERTGIGTRRISTGDTVASLAAKACENALSLAGKKAEEVDLILVATCSMEMLLPNCACQVQSIIGAKNAVAFDLNAACAGFLFALQTAYAYLKCGFYKNALVVGSEVLSKLMDWTDRSTCILFGDGAGAVYLESDTSNETENMLSFVQGSDGEKGMVLQCLARELKNPFVKPLPQESNPYIQMNGQEVYRFAVKQVPQCIEQALEQANVTADDVDLFILHQANVRIIEAVAKRLHVDLDKFPMNLDKTGNMSSATVPVLLDEINRSGKLQKGQTIVLAGFGAGLTYGACVMKW